MRTSRTSVTWLASVLVVLASGALLARDASSDLIGRWQLNEKESEDPKAKFRPLRPGEDPKKPDAGAEEDAQRDAERRGRRTRGDGRRPDARRPDTPSGPLEAPPGLPEFLDPPRALTISGSDAELTLDDGKGTPLRLPVDGAEHKQGAVAYTARWEGSALVVEKKNEHGARLTTRYSLLPGQKKLEVYSRLAGTQGRAVTLRRVYDGAEAAS